MTRNCVMQYGALSGFKDEAACL